MPAQAAFGEKRDAMELWVDHIERLVMPEGVKALR